MGKSVKADDDTAKTKTPRKRPEKGSSPKTPTPKRTTAKAAPVAKAKKAAPMEYTPQRFATEKLAPTVTPTVKATTKAKRTTAARVADAKRETRESPAAAPWKQEALPEAMLPTPKTDDDGAVSEKLARMMGAVATPKEPTREVMKAAASVVDLGSHGNATVTRRAENDGPIRVAYDSGNRLVRIHCGRRSAFTEVEVKHGGNVQRIVRETAMSLGLASPVRFDVIPHGMCRGVKVARWRLNLSNGVAELLIPPPHVVAESKPSERAYGWRLSGSLESMYRKS